MYSFLSYLIKLVLHKLRFPFFCWKVTHPKLKCEDSDVTESQTKIIFSPTVMIQTVIGADSDAFCEISELRCFVKMR